MPCNTDSLHTGLDVLYAMQDRWFKRVSEGYAFAISWEWELLNVLSTMRECSHENLAKVNRRKQLDAIRWDFSACGSHVKSIVRQWLPKVSHDIFDAREQLYAIGGEVVYQKIPMLIQKNFAPV